MKMTQGDFEALELAISTIPAGKTFDGIKAEYLAAGLTERRFRFDCLWAIPTANRQAWFDRGIYDYLNDDHIHTALRKIVG